MSLRGQNFGPDGLVADDAVANLTKINNGTQAPPPCTLASLNATVDANNHINTDSTYAYDARGNMTKDGSGTGWSYAFDSENRLTLATGPTGGPYCYVYDGLGLRVAKKSGTANDCSGGTFVKLYWRSLSGDSLAETDGSGNTQNEYVFFAGRRIASRVTSNGNVGIFYYFADQLGSTRTITTGSGKNPDGTNQTPGQLCYDADFTPYGQEISYSARLQTTACPPSYKFTGYERDSETGLDYAFARYYSSRLGRFLSTDPLGGAIGDLQSHNGYAYVTNNPTNFTDPSGLCRPSEDCRDGYIRGPCGLDCIFAGGSTGGGGIYGGYCPAEFQGCVNNGNGGFIGIVGSNVGYDCDRPGLEIASVAVCDDAPTVFFSISSRGNSSPGPQNTGNHPKQADCMTANIAAVNQVSNLNVTDANVTRSFFRNGAWNYDFSVSGGSMSSLPAGRYPSSVFNGITGIGRSLHAPPNDGGNLNADPSIYGMSSSGAFTFTTHIDSAYATWHTPIGALLHWFIDVRDKGAHRPPC
jgi:RHS repeat-associated protein